MQYLILEGDYEGLAVKVTSHLTAGWELHGSPYSVHNAHFQAVVLHTHAAAGQDKNTPAKKQTTKAAK